MIEEKPKILIVDDEHFSINLLKSLLKNDYKIMVATNGEQALKGAVSGKPDLILLDIIMPEMDGYEVLRCLKEDSETKSIPVIIISAMSDPSDETRGFELGAVDYITKPFDIFVVKSRIYAHLGMKHENDPSEKLKSSQEES